MTTNDSRTDTGGQDGNDAGNSSASRRRFMKATAAGALTTGFGTSLVGTAAAAGIPTPWLDRDGNLLRDPSDNKVILRGVNIPDPLRAARDAPYYKRRPETLVKMATDESNGWQSRIIRIPMQPNDIAREGAGSVMPVAFTQEQLDSYLRNYVDPTVEKCKDVGAYCILDYHRHWPDGPDWTSDPLDEEIQMFWNTVASRYGGQSHVLFEVYNEPTTPYAGQEYGSDIGVTDAPAEDTWLNWRETAQPWVDTIREHAPRNVIIVGSPRWSQWTYWAPKHEFTGDNLAYTAHVYTQENLRPLSTYFGEPSDQVPVFMSEFGWGGSSPHLSGSVETYGPQFANLFDNYDMHWQAWCFDFDWNPAMLNRQYEVANPWGQWVKDRLQAKKDTNVPTASNTSGDTTAPTAPTGVTVSGTSPNSVTVSWSASSDSGGSGLSGYEVAAGPQTTSVSAGTTQATVSGLTRNISYDVTVVAVDGAGNRSTIASVTAQPSGTPGGGGGDTTAPSAPTGLTVSGTSANSVSLSWTAASDSGGSGLSEYEVSVGSQTTTVSSGTTQATVTGLSAGTTYDVSVVAVDGAGNRSSGATATATTGGGSPSVEPINGKTPQNIDSDAAYEDLNANDGVDFDDVVVFSNHRTDPVMTDHTAAYDYNGNSDLDFDDLVQLFGETQ